MAQSYGLLKNANMPQALPRPCESVSRSFNSRGNGFPGSEVSDFSTMPPFYPTASGEPTLNQLLASVESGGLSDPLLGSLSLPTIPAPINAMRIQINSSRCA